MLRDLNITNFAIINKVRIEFEEGLSLLTGETGAGKSIIIDALGMALGLRASSDFVHSGAKEASVEAVFNLSPEFEGIAEEAGFSLDGELILRRRLSSAGVSRAYVNDSQVSVSTLRQLGELLVAVHGQGEGDELLGPEGQLAILDAFANAADQVAEISKLYSKLTSLEEELEKINTDERERLRELDLLSHQISEIEAVKLDPQEAEDLSRQVKLLRNSEKLRELTGSAFQQLYAGDSAITERLTGVIAKVSELTEFEPSFKPALDQLDALRIQMDDVASSLRDFLARIDYDPQQLERMEARFDAIKTLQKKYGPSTEEVISYLERARHRREELLHADERSEELRKETDKVRRQYDEAAESLRRSRREAIKDFVGQVERHLSELAMEKARLHVEMSDHPRGRTRTGIDRINFLIAPNPGEELKPLAKIASGGELSRLMLAIKSCAVEPKRFRTVIFDEVDAGIGGRVAEFVGRKLKRLSDSQQVICITHLPQVTVYADHHSKVVKRSLPDSTEVTVESLSGDARLEELARMMGGEEITDVTREHARDLLKQARDYSLRK